jgi:hypothetical protein
MCDQRQDLTVDPESADAGVSTVAQRLEQFPGVVQAKAGQIAALFRSRKPGLVGRRGSPEFNGSLDEDTAQPQANHAPSPLTGSDGIRAADLVQISPPHPGLSCNASIVFLQIGTADGTIFIITAVVQKVGHQRDSVLDSSHGSPSLRG